MDHEHATTSPEIPRQPPRITERETAELCETYGFVPGPQFWRAAEALPQSPRIVTNRKTGRALAINPLRDRLEATYATTAKTPWRGAGARSLYAMNIIVNHFDDAGAAVPQFVLSATERDMFRADPEPIVAFAQAEGIMLSQQLATNTLQRIGTGYVQTHYGNHNYLLPKGHYETTGVDYALTAAEFGGRDVMMDELRVPALRAGLYDPGMLHRATINPRAHYAMLRYVRALEKRGMLEGQTLPATDAPKHPAFAEAFQPARLAAHQILDLLIIRSKHLSPREPALSVVKRAAQLAEKGVYYPLTGILGVIEEEPACPRTIGLSRSRAARFLTNMLSAGDTDLTQTLIQPSQFAKLAALDARYGIEEQLPVPLYPEATWTDEPVVTLSGFRRFAAQYNKEVDPEEFQSAIDTALAGYLSSQSATAAYEQGSSHDTQGIRFTVVKAHDPRSYFNTLETAVEAITAKRALQIYGAGTVRTAATAIVLGKYLKSLAQAGATRR